MDVILKCWLFFFTILYMGHAVFFVRLHADVAVWKAKGQYMISYFWLLLPLSAEEYIEITKHILSLIKKPAKLLASRALAATGIALLSVIALVFLALTYCMEENIVFIDNCNGSDQQKWIVDMAAQTN